MSAALALPLANGNTPGSLVMPAAGDNLGVTAGRVPMIPLAGPLPTAAAANDPSTAFRSDEHGAFRLEGLPPGTLRIVARKPGFAAGESAERTLHPGELQGGVKLTLSRGGTVIGQVVDTHDAPIARVHVELLVESEGLARSTVSDEHGGFKFAAVRGRLTVTAYPPGLPPVRASAEVHAIEEQHVVLKIDAETVTLEGRVLDGRSRPIESATISLRALAASTPFAITVLTGADGRFEIPGLPAPPYRISADHAEYAPSKPITVKAVAASAPVEIQLASGSSLHGAVIDGQTNEPITGARIALGNLGARSHGDGTFEFLHVSDGHYTVSIDAPGFIAERRELELGPPEPEREEVFVLTPAGSVSGDVVDRLGAPVWNAEVAAGNPADWSHVARTDHAGHFVLAGLPPGDVQLSARHASAGALPLGGQTHVYPRQETPGAVLRLPDVGR
jgi:hypothetical protein